MRTFETLGHDLFFEDIYVQTFGLFPGPPGPEDETEDDAVLNDQDREEFTIDSQSAGTADGTEEQKDTDIEKTLGTDPDDIVE